MTNRKTKGARAASSPGEVTSSAPALVAGEGAPGGAHSEAKPVPVEAMAASQGPKTAKPTKASKLEGLLGSPEGATLAHLCDALGWQSHTVRAALTRLRQAGHAVERGKDEAGLTVYRIAMAERSVSDGPDARSDEGEGEQNREERDGDDQPVPSPAAQDGASE